VSGVEIPDETYFESVVSSEVLLTEAEQLANLGGWELDIETGLISRSANLCKMPGAEALMNVHRHSGTQGVALRLAHVKGYIVVEMQDHGSGIPFNGFSQRSRGLTGVGIQGTRERGKERKGCSRSRASREKVQRCE
jgi:signal transduction histidine kinase